jgi:DNA (cytosine-5)-methyltransferase 1
MGYHRAGFEVVGVDINPQPHYPFEFHQADALTYPLDGFDVIHASPPCQGYSACKTMHTCRDRSYTQLIPEIRNRLDAFGAPYVIENVVGAPLKSPIMLCGLSFGLHLFRHRLFESNLFLLEPSHTKHRDRVGENGFVCMAGHGDSGRGRILASHRSKASWVNASGIDWMTRQELSQAIPPAYTEFIGRQLIDYLNAMRGERVTI